MTSTTAPHTPLHTPTPHTRTYTHRYGLTGSVIEICLNYSFNRFAPWNGLWYLISTLWLSVRSIVQLHLSRCKLSHNLKAMRCSKIHFLWYLYKIVNVNGIFVKSAKLRTYRRPWQPLPGSINIACIFVKYLEMESSQRPAGGTHIRCPLSWVSYRDAGWTQLSMIVRFKLDDFSTDRMQALTRGSITLSNSSLLFDVTVLRKFQYLYET